MICDNLKNISYYMSCVVAVLNEIFVFSNGKSHVYKEFCTTQDRELADCLLADLQVTYSCLLYTSRCV